LLCFVLFTVNTAKANAFTTINNSLNKVIVCNNIIDTTIDTNNIKVLEVPQFYYGKASFYSANLEGTATSTQEIFKHNKFTCASNRFKLNTWLRVTNIANDKSIIVRVNDRMHPKMDAKGRIVDLSYAGAKKLGFIEKGVTKVRVEIVAKDTKK
jgi:rare lipoprotein A